MRSSRALRLPLGPDTYEDVRGALQARLTEHEAGRDTAYSVGTAS